MAWVSGPFVRFKCAKCARKIERLVAEDCRDEIHKMRDAFSLVCNECMAALELR